MVKLKKNKSILPHCFHIHTLRGVLENITFVHNARDTITKIKYKQYVGTINIDWSIIL